MQVPCRQKVNQVQWRKIIKSPRFAQHPSTAHLVEVHGMGSVSCDSSWQGEGTEQHTTPCLGPISQSSVESHLPFASEQREPHLYWTNLKICFYSIFFYVSSVSKVLMPPQVSMTFCVFLRESVNE